jgi:hemolysin III
MTVARKDGVMNAAAMPTDGALSLPEKVKPRLRGVFHFLGFFASWGGVLAMSFAPQTGWRLVSGVLYAASLTSMLFLSSLYHRPMWSDAARDRLRKVDHAGIFFLIAGTYTPFAALLNPHGLTVGLVGMWAGAVAGVAHAYLNSHGNRLLRALVYVILGLSAIPTVVQLPALTGAGPVALLVAGAVVYISGAVVYAKRWPNPRPSVFGYHEVFHVMVLVAAALHFAAVFSVQYSGA